MSVEINLNWHYPLTAHPADAIGKSYRGNNWGKKTVIFLANIASLPAQLLGLTIGGPIGGVAAVALAALNSQSKSKGFADGATNGSAAGVLAFSVILFPLTFVSLGLARAAGNKGVCLRANTLANRILRKKPDTATRLKVNIETKRIKCQNLIDKLIDNSDPSHPLRLIPVGIMSSNPQIALNYLNPAVTETYNKEALDAFLAHLNFRIGNNQSDTPSDNFEMHQERRLVKIQEDLDAYYTFLKTFSRTQGVGA